MSDWDKPEEDMVNEMLDRIKNLKIESDQLELFE